MFTYAKWLKTAVQVGALVSLSQLAMTADAWQVDADDSTLAFVSVKKDMIGEVHTFDSLSGTLAADGKFSLMIDLASVNTGIDIRNQRMRDFLFEVSKFASATATGQLTSDLVGGLEVGASEVIDLPFTLSLHGVEKSLTASVQVSKLAGDKVAVATVKPVIINAADFALTGGVAKLQELAALPSIAAAVPVTFSLILTQ